MPNRFKNPMLRGVYESTMNAFKTKHRDLFHKDGSRNTLNAVGMMFWRGYDGTTLGAEFTDASSKNTPAYASWRAGQDAKKAAEVQPQD